MTGYRRQGGKGPYSTKKGEKERKGVGCTGGARKGRNNDEKREAKGI